MDGQRERVIGLRGSAGPAGRARSGRRRSASLAAAATLTAVALGGAGCGESAKTATAGSAAGGAGGPVASVADAPSGKGDGGEAVAAVDGSPIAKSALAHWTAVTAALGGAKQQGGAASSTVRNQALAFLITSRWVLDEAARRGVSVSAAEAHGRLAQSEAKQFPKPGDLQRFLASSGGETTADLLERSRLELLEAKIAQHVTAGKSGAQATAALDRFRGAFESRWRAKTTCRPGYVMEDCREYTGPRHPSAGAAASSSSSSSSSAASSGGHSSSGRSSHAASSSSETNGEVYSAPGAMSIESPAFERNGAIPASYVCAGGPPPLRWQHLPAHTVEMVLFVIDDSADGSNGGIRWVVAGLTPATTGIQGGKLPAGAVVGQSSAGNAAYGGICPASGHSDRIEFVLWALKKQIPLSNGFVPAVAESEYSKSELGSAVTYAVASH